MPIASARRSGGARSATIVLPAVLVAESPAPCSERTPSSGATERASGYSASESTKFALPATSSGLRP